LASKSKNLIILSFSLRFQFEEAGGWDQQLSDRTFAIFLAAECFSVGFITL